MLLELAILGVAVIAALSIVYSTVKVGISPMPSSAKAYHAMIELIEDSESGPIVDLGSGWGTFILRAAKRFPERQIVGYELSLLPWLTSLVFKRILRLKNLTVYRQDFFKAKFPKAAILVCYLYPEAMKKIEDILLKEKQQVGCLISNNFALPNRQADKTIRINDFYKSPIYFYKMHGDAT